MSSMDFVREQFERTWPWLEKAVDVYGKTHAKEHVWKALECGDAQLWPMPNAAMVTTIEVHPTGLKEIKGWLAGGDLREILEWEPEVVKWGKSMGCQRASIVGRRGWLKAFNGYRDIATVMVKDI